MENCKIKEEIEELEYFYKKGESFLGKLKSDIEKIYWTNEVGVFLGSEAKDFLFPNKSNHISYGGVAHSSRLHLLKCKIENYKEIERNNNNLFLRIERNIPCKDGEIIQKTEYNYFYINELIDYIKFNKKETINLLYIKLSDLQNLIHSFSKLKLEELKDK